MAVSDVLERDPDEIAEWARAIAANRIAATGEVEAALRSSSSGTQILGAAETQRLLLYATFGLLLGAVDPWGRQMSPAYGRVREAALMAGLQWERVVPCSDPEGRLERVLLGTART